MACRYCFYAPGTGQPGAVMEEATLAAMTRFLRLNADVNIRAGMVVFENAGQQRV